MYRHQKGMICVNLTVSSNARFGHQTAPDVSNLSDGLGSFSDARRKSLSVRYVPEAEVNLEILNGSLREI